jgi:hypothetical protein
MDNQQLQEIDLRQRRHLNYAETALGNIDPPDSSRIA